jgi:hypothetical protein
MPIWDDWVRVCYHEAGHAVVSLALSDPAKPTVLRCIPVQGQLQAQGTYQLPAALLQDGQFIPPLQLIMRLAAGGVAEEIRFGNHTDGVTGDHTKINTIITRIQHQECIQERQGNYPDTRALLQANWPAVVRIAEITLRRFRPMQLADVGFENTPVLSANAVSRIFTNPPLTGQEHATAQLKAYLYARERGNGADPEFQPHLAIEDFEKAAGDVFGELQ